MVSEMLNDDPTTNNCKVHVAGNMLHARQQQGFDQVLQCAGREEQHHVLTIKGCTHQSSQKMSTPNKFAADINLLRLAAVYLQISMFQYP
jgi:hypothetical protein